MAFCCDSFSLLRQLCTVGHSIFYVADVGPKRLFIGEANNAYFCKYLFKNSVYMAKSNTTVRFTFSLSIAIF